MEKSTGKKPRTTNPIAKAIRKAMVEWHKQRRKQGQTLALRTEMFRCKDGKVSFMLGTPLLIKNKRAGASELTSTYLQSFTSFVRTLCMKMNLKLAFVSDIIGGRYFMVIMPV